MKVIEINGELFVMFTGEDGRLYKMLVTEANEDEINAYYTQGGN